MFIDLIFNSVTFIFNYEFPSSIFFHREKYILKASNFFEIFLRYFGNIFKYFLTYTILYVYICLALRFKLPHEFSYAHLSRKLSPCSDIVRCYDITRSPRCNYMVTRKNYSRRWYFSLLFLFCIYIG